MKFFSRLFRSKKRVEKESLVESTPSEVKTETVNINKDKPSFSVPKIDIITEYTRLSDSGKWEEALPVIEEIVSRNNRIPTSWFNWGVCLSALGNEAEAAGKFLKAYELNPKDFGAQYRVFRSLYFSNEFDKLLQFAEAEFKKVPEIFELLSEDNDLAAIFDREEFCLLRDKLTKKNC